LLQAAESALQRARRKGRNSYEIYHRSLPGPASGPDAGLEAELHRAVERGELHLAYQPQVDLAQERLCGVEALLRWRRPDGEAVSPARFIPALEETGLIQGVGEWILEEACHQARGWTASGSAGPPRLSVNLSVRQFGDPERLCRAVFRALDNSGLDPARLELEITEGLFLESELHPRDSIQRLRERGVRVALDDFGTGYSALGYLHRFPLDTLKIDQCFIRDLDAPHAEDLVSGILNLARPFGLEVVAEGVETADHARRLHRLGCPLAQGFGYARPGTPGQVAKLLRAGGHLPLQRA
jgi:EAL domain-containing protein (putative c-di-GMP-specific phosphodiesterase class I)